MRRSSSAACVSRLRRQLDDRQELEADRNAQKVNQISGELGGVKTLLTSYLGTIQIIRDTLGGGGGSKKCHLTIFIGNFTSKG